jgi:hypothetical protein
MGPISYPEISVMNYTPIVRGFSKESRPHLKYDGNLK